MRIASWEHYEIDPPKMVFLAAVISVGLGALFQVLTGDVLGGNSIELSIVVSGVIFYMVLSSPKRLLESATLSQAREATSLAAASSANFEATHSKSRSILMLGTTDREISSLLVEAKRGLLLGLSVPDLMGSAAERTVSQSAKSVFTSIASMDPGLIEERGEESQSIARASELSEESKLPLFTAVAFFSPIMLTLFAVLTHQSDPKSFAELIVVQFVAMDLAFYFASTEKKMMS